MFTVSQNFYKDYLRTIIYLENNTYTQGYNKKYGLLANNGFKIYQRYFYFSDKYKSLDFKMYSSYKKRFYNTNYGDVFNYDFSVANNYNIIILIKMIIIFLNYKSKKKIIFVDIMTWIL